MCVHAHPDDESSKGAATMARYVREGIEVLVVTCTGGERGDVLNPKMDRPEVQENLPRVRNEEMARAREILGVDQHWLGFTDSGLPDGWLPDSGIPCPRTPSIWCPPRRPPRRWSRSCARSARTW
ncbi:hypothetical protein GCM10029992_65860 [Glycomyces albus]